ncbi:MAG TPA: DNA-formamidopyrimidine glycosylase family protein [Anaerolineae bacterium]|nr:DNA-formamidopyrimidine glycosylase family protein [Anaerolineae bacterium]
MSEGPEVKRTAARLQEALAGETIRHIEAHHKKIVAWLEQEPKAIIGRKILRVHAIGKHILFDLDSGSHLHNHLLMFGHWRIHGARAKIERDPRIMEIIRTEKHCAVLYGGSVFELLPAGTLEKHPSLKKLGPDVLGEEFDEQQALENLRQHPAVEIGVALLDQEILAGIGNYLKSEILFLARINPRTRISELSDKQLRDILHISREVTRFSFENSGYTVPPEIRARLGQQGMSPQTVGRKHYVFRRTNKPCWVCGTPIRQYRQGPGKGRITYVCPNCQAA